MSSQTIRYIDGQFTNDCDNQNPRSESYLRNQSGSNCYVPCSGTDCEGKTGKDNNGNYYYGCMISPGDNSTVCQTTFIKGFPGDITSELVNTNINDIAAERGITLYENLGLTEGVGLNGIYGKDQGEDVADRILYNPSTPSVNDSEYFDILKFYNTVYFNRSVISNLGRKLCLYGNVEFSTFDYGAITSFARGRVSEMDESLGVDIGKLDDVHPSYPGYKSKTDNNLLDFSLIKNAISNNLGFNERLPFLSGFVHRIKFNVESSNPDNYYKYFGNSAVEMHLVNDVVFRFNAKNTKFNKTSIYFFMGKWYFLKFWDNESQTLFIDTSFWYFSQFIKTQTINNTNIPVLVLPPSFVIYPISTSGLWNIIPVIKDNKISRTYETQTSISDPEALSSSEALSSLSSGYLISPGVHIPISHAYDGYTSYRVNLPDNPVYYKSATDDSFMRYDLDVNRTKKDIYTEGGKSNMTYPIMYNNEFLPKPMMSGFKSLYIPPHMEIQSYIQTRFTTIDDIPYDKAGSFDLRKRIFTSGDTYGNYSYRLAMLGYTERYHPFDSWTEDYRNISDSRDNVNPLPLRYNSSKELNGAFYTFGNSVPNSMAGTNINADDETSSNFWFNSNLSDDRNIFKNRRIDTTYGTAGIFNGSLLGLKVCVRTDTEFYNQYLLRWATSSFDIRKAFIPEIVLNPNFTQGESFILNVQNANNTQIDITDLQKVTDPNSYWSDYNNAKSMNQEYWDSGDPNSKASIVLNPDVKAYDALPKPDGSTSASNEIVTALVKPQRNIARFISKQIKNNSISNLLFKPISTQLDAITETNTSNLRILDFDIVNGIYSIEWLYVLYSCAMNCQDIPQVDASASDKQISLNYTAGDASSPNCVECRLFNKPTIKNADGTIQDVSTNSLSLSFMRNYCGFRNLTYLYSALSPLGRTVLNNECYCQVNNTFCPSTYKNMCNINNQAFPSSYQAYIGDNITKDNCSVDTYCESQVKQIAIATKGGADTSKLISDSNSCNINIDQNGNVSGSPSSDSSTSPEDTDTDDTNGINIVLILIIIAIILIPIIIGVGYYIYKKNKKV